MWCVWTGAYRKSVGWRWALEWSWRADLGSLCFWFIFPWMQSSFKMENKCLETEPMVSEKRNVVTSITSLYKMHCATKLSLNIEVKFYNTYKNVCLSLWVGCLSRRIYLKSDMSDVVDSSFDGVSFQKSFRRVILLHLWKSFCSLLVEVWFHFTVLSFAYSLRRK